MRQMPPSFGLQRLAQDYLISRPLKAGQTIQIGWFIFRIADDTLPPRIESLDFLKMASFTTDFTAAEKIRDLQIRVLERCGVEATGCTLLQTALVSRSYSPQRSDVFIKRQDSNGENDSGWYVGVLDEQKRLDDADSFALRSLYELTIADPRMAPFWLLPIGKTVMLSAGDVV